MECLNSRNLSQCKRRKLPVWRTDISPEVRFGGWGRHLTWHAANTEAWGDRRVMAGRKTSCLSAVFPRFSRFSSSWGNAIGLEKVQDHNRLLWVQRHGRSSMGPVATVAAEAASRKTKTRLARARLALVDS